MREICLISCCQLAFFIVSLRASSVVIGLFLGLVIHMDEAVGPACEEPTICILVRGYHVARRDVLIDQELMICVHYLDICIFNMLPLVFGVVSVCFISNHF